MATKKITGVKHTFKKNTKGDVVVEHPKGKGGKINLTEKNGSKSVKAGVKSSVKYHKGKPHGK